MCCVWHLLRTAMPSQEIPAETSTSGPKVNQKQQDSKQTNENSPTNGHFLSFTGGNRISQVLSEAHEGGIFSICVLKDGTMVSGGGKDRKVVLWDQDYRKQTDMEVRVKNSVFI